MSEHERAKRASGIRASGKRYKSGKSGKSENHRSTDPRDGHPLSTA